MRYLRSTILGIAALILINLFATAELKKGDKLYAFSLKSTEDKEITLKVNEDKLTLIEEFMENGKKIIKKTYPDVVLLDFWAIWCVPCRAAIPHLQKLYEKYKPKEGQDKGGVVLIGISLDRKGLKVVKPFVKKLKLKYIMLADSSGQSSDKDLLQTSKDIADKYKVIGLPVVYVVDSEGVIQHVHVGFKKEYIAKLESKIKKIISQGKQ